MAITGYTGPPGAGKSYAMVSQVIVPAVAAGRRVLTNIEGVDPEKVRLYASQLPECSGPVGSVVLFDGNDATAPGFFPTQDIPDTDTFLKGGDLLVFDEWRLYWPRRGKLPSNELEPFLRWHRHLTGERADGKVVACDVVIGSQLLSDVHQDFRGLIERSYKFKKLSSVGLSKVYAWDAYEGHLQPKGSAYSTGNGTYRPEIFALYQSYGAGANATELKTDKRTSAFGKGTVIAVALGFIVACFSAWWVWGYFTGGAEAVTNQPGALPQGTPMAVAQAAAARPAASRFRIVGQIEDDYGVRVVVSDNNGATRLMEPQNFDFVSGRAVAGTVEGQRVVAEDRLSVEGTPSILPGMVP